MRVQFRYEVLESLNGLLEQYRDASRSDNPEVKVLDERRLAAWEEKEKHGAYLSRIASVYLIWDPVKHKRALIASGGPQSKENRKRAGGGFTLSVRKAIQKTRKEHMDTLAEFESIIAGVESAMKGGGLGPERMTHGDIFLEIKRALSPMDPDPTPLKENVVETRDVSAREKLASVNILGQTESQTRRPAGVPCERRRASRSSLKEQRYENEGNVLRREHACDGAHTLPNWSVCAVWRHLFSDCEHDYRADRRSTQ